jgi:dTMP kinase
MEINSNIIKLNLAERKKKSKTCTMPFITFEGIDGSGKSVQASRISARLSQSGYSVIAVRDPGGPSISEKIRTVLLDRNLLVMSPNTELFLYEAARSQLVSETIRPALEEGKIVVCDRFIDSTVAYQGYGRKISLDFINTLNLYACDNTLPGRTYILDISLEESLRRRLSSGHREDRIEQNMKPFYNRVRKGYLILAKSEPLRIRLINGNKSIEDLEDEIYRDVLLFLENVKFRKSGCNQ